jgi:hypothetical protein
VPALTSFLLVPTGLRRGCPWRRAQLTVRAAGLVGGTILTVCVALAATAPASAASVARPAVLAAASAPAASDPSGVQAKEAAIANAATGLP